MRCAVTCCLPDTEAAAVEAMGAAVEDTVVAVAAKAEVGRRFLSLSGAACWWLATC